MADGTYGPLRGHCEGTTGKCFSYFSPSDEFVRMQDPATGKLATFQPRLTITFDR